MASQVIWEGKVRNVVGLIYDPSGPTKDKLARIVLTKRCNSPRLQAHSYVAGDDWYVENDRKQICEIFTEHYFGEREKLSVFYEQLKTLQSHVLDNKMLAGTIVRMEEFWPELKKELQNDKQVPQ